ncbi:MAG: phosphatidylserine decarboxylase, partial [Planctomycetota bacterium]
RFGMIKFGSRTDLVVPLRLHPVPLVRRGDRVKGGATAVLRLPGIDATARPASASEPHDPESGGTGPGVRDPGGREQGGPVSRGGSGAPVSGPGLSGVPGKRESRGAQGEKG